MVKSIHTRERTELGNIKNASQDTSDTEGTEKRRIKLKPSIPHFIPEDQLIVKKNVVNERTTGDLGFVNASNL